MISHAVWSQRTEEMKFSEIVEALSVFFTPEELEEARNFLTGQTAGESK